MSPSDGTASVNLSSRQEPDLTLDRAFRHDPRNTLDDIAAGWLWSEEVGGIVGYVVFCAVLQCPVYGSIPCSLPFVIGGPFTEGAGDPVGWLIGDGREFVAVPVADFEFKVQVFDDRFFWNVVRLRQSLPCA